MIFWRHIQQSANKLWRPRAVTVGKTVETQELAAARPRERRVTGRPARRHSCPASTSSTTRSVRRSVLSGSYFFVRLAPNAHAKAW